MSAILVETILRMVEADVRFNISSDSRTFECKFIEPGLISYRDHEKGGIELLRRETIERAMPTCIGNALTLKHVIVTASNRLQEEQGIITDWYFNPSDGWFWVKGYVDTPAAQVKIKAGKKPSCGYIVNSFGPAGKYHDIRYDKELTQITFNHLAIVDRPRFEDAMFRLNSVHVSQSNNMNVLKFLKKLVTRENGADGKPTESTKVESHEVPTTTQVEIDGKMVPLSDVVSGFRANAAAPATPEALQVAADDEVEIDGKPVKVSDLIAGYRKNAASAPAETEEQKKARERETARLNEAPEGETPEQKAEREKKLRLNSAATERPFLTLHTARHNAAAATPAPSRPKHSGSISDRCKTGQEKYGSVVVVSSGKN